MTPEKRRKVLSDIGNFELPPPRRKSLGFDVASVGLEEMHSNSSDSNIPDPPPSRLLAINSLAGMHLKSSNIPVINKQKSYRSLVAVKENLDAKSKLPSNLQLWKNMPREIFKPEVDVESLQNDKLMLDRELKSAQALLEQLDTEYDEKRRLYRILENQSSDLRFRLRHLEAKFELKGNSITQKILHEELIAEIELKELENKLDDEFSQQQFQLRNEVMDSGNFEDTQALLELERLKNEKIELEKQMEEVVLERDEAIRREIETNKFEVSKLNEKKEELTRDIKRNNEGLESKLKRLQTKLQAVLLEKQKEEAQLTALQTKINYFRASTDDTGVTTEKLEADLRQKQAEIDNLKNEANLYHQQLESQRQKYEEAKRKFENYVSVHRVLEDAIMCFSSNPRTFVKLTTNSNVTIQDENILHFEGRSYQFSKILLQNEDQVCLRWEPFVQRTLSQDNASIIFAGSEKQDMCSRLLEVFRFLSAGMQKRNGKGWSYKFYLQGACISELIETDLFKSSIKSMLHFENEKLVDVAGQRMHITNLSDIEHVLDNFQLQPGALTCFFFLIQAVNEKANKSLTNQLVLVDLTNMSLELQTQTLSLQSIVPAQNKLLSHLKKHTRNLFFCEVGEMCKDTLNLLRKLSAL